MAVYYYIITSLAISFISLFSGVSFFKKRRLDTSAFYLSVFFLANSCIWLATAVATIFWRVGRGDLFEIFALISYFFVFASGPGVLGYGLRRNIKNIKISRAIFWLFSLVFVTGVVFMLKDGLLEPRITEWGAKSGLFGDAYFIFKTSMTVIVPILLISFFKEIYNKFIAKKNISMVGFMTDLSVGLYITVTYFDAGALVLGWQLVLTRIFMVIFLISAYLGFSKKLENEKSLLLEV